MRIWMGTRMRTMPKYAVFAVNQLFCVGEVGLDPACENIEAEPEEEIEENDESFLKVCFLLG